MLAVPVLGQPGPELIPQERERRDLMIAAPVASLQYTIRVLSGCNSRPTCARRAAIASRTWRACCFAGAVHHRVIAVPLERDPGYSRAIHVSNA